MIEASNTVEHDAIERQAEHRAAPMSGAERSFGRELAYAVRRRGLTIVGLAAFMGLLASALASLTAPLPTATAELRIDKTTASSVSPQERSDAIEAQIRALRSPSVLSRAMQDAGLGDEHASGGATHLLEQLGRAVPWMERFRPPAETGEEKAQALALLQNRAAIAPTSDQAGIRITVTAASPESAARTAEAIAEASLPEPPKTGAVDQSAASEEATKKLDEQKRRVIETREALDQSKAQGSTWSDPINGGRRAALSTRLDAARVRTAALRDRLERIDRTRHGGGALTRKPAEAFGSTVLTALNAHAARLLEWHAAMQEQLGPRHPDIIAINSELREVRQRIGAELDRIARGTKIDLARAQAGEADLAQSLNQLAPDVVVGARDADRLRALQRDRDAAEAAYSDSLARTEIVGPAAPAEVKPTFTVVRATASSAKHGWSRQAIFILSAVAAGLGIGVAWAGATERTEPTIRSPDQLEDLLGMPVIFVRRAGPKDPALDRLLRRIVTGRRARGKENFVYGVLLAGGSRASARLATALAEAAGAIGERVIHVEAAARLDAHRNTVGLVDVLRGEVPLESALARADHANVVVLPAGRPSATDWRQTTSAGWLFAQFARRFDLMIVDGNTARLQTRTAPLFVDCAEVFLVLERGNYLNAEAVEPIEGLRALGTTPTAIVLLDRI